MKYHRKLTELEMYDLVLLAYPEKFRDDDEHDNWDEVIEFVDELSGFDDIADFVGRLVMLTIPIERTNMKGKTIFEHCLGESKVVGDRITTAVCVKREYNLEMK